LRSLKVIENDTIRSGTHDFLLMFHSNQAYRWCKSTEGLSRIVSEKKTAISVENRQHFSSPVYLHPLMKGLPGYPWNRVSAQEPKKLEWWSYQNMENF